MFHSNFVRRTVKLYDLTFTYKENYERGLGSFCCHTVRGKTNRSLVKEWGRNRMRRDITLPRLETFGPKGLKGPKSFILVTTHPKTSIPLFPLSSPEEGRERWSPSVTDVGLRGRGWPLWMVLRSRVVPIVQDPRPLWWKRETGKSDPTTTIMIRDPAECQETTEESLRR